MKGTVAFLLAAAVVASAARASYDEPAFNDCRKMDDCTGGDDGDATTICQVFDSISLPATADDDAVTYNWGKCVQCTSDCDCRPDEWCSPALKIDSQWWNDAEATRMGDANVAARKGMLASWTAGSRQLAGKCLKIGDSDAESEKLGSTCSVDPTSSDNSEAHSSAKANCNYVASWQPEKIQCVTANGGTCPDPAVDNPNANKPGTCTATVASGDNTATASVTGSCASTGGVGWSGYCNDDLTCQQCRDGQTRCGSGTYPRRCYGGKWGPMDVIPDRTARSIRTFAFGQIMVSLMVFLIVLALAMCVNCICTVRLASKAGDAAEKSSANPAYKA